MAEAAHSSIAEFYRGRCLLVTGGTGFMGKVLVEKLLRSCPAIDTVYLLMRPKKGQEVATRLEEMLKATLFDVLRRERPDALLKLVPVSGDVMSPDLGICPADQALLTARVSVVFHAAATIKFDEPLRLSVAMNIEGTKKIVQLCHRMPKLEALIHVSTAYCNCDRKDVGEIVYPPPADPEKIMQCVEWMDDGLLDMITPILIGNRPNTYSFTKALAEHVLVDQAGDLPVAIVRPSIVSASYREPIPGWVDNLNGPTGMIIGAGKGIFSSFYCHGDLVSDMIPVDICINMLITAAWHTATVRPRNIQVFNCTSGQVNPVTWSDMSKSVHDFVRRYPYTEVVQYPGVKITGSHVYNTIHNKTFHVVPAYLTDLLAKLFGKKAIMVRIQKNMRRAVSSLEYFTTHDWNFASDNVVLLMDQLSPVDRETFNFDIRGLVWRDYFEKYVLGVRRFVIKEEPSTIPAARANHRRMYYIHRAALLLLTSVAFRVLLSRSATVRHLWFALVSVLLRVARLVPSLVQF